MHACKLTSEIALRRMWVAEDVDMNIQSTHVLTKFRYQKNIFCRPGGVRQQFKAVLPMVESILQGLKGTPELQGPLQASIWDQGDAVGAWLGDKLVAVVFPTPETLPQVADSPPSLSWQLVSVSTLCCLYCHAHHKCAHALMWKLHALSIGWES